METDYYSRTLDYLRCGDGEAAEADREAEPEFSSVHPNTDTVFTGPHSKASHGVFMSRDEVIQIMSDMIAPLRADIATLKSQVTALEERVDSAFQPHDDNEIKCRNIL